MERMGVQVLLVKRVEGVGEQEMPDPILQLEVLQELRS